MKQKWTRLLAGLLVFAMVISLLPGMSLQVLAEDEPDVVPPEAVEPLPDPEIPQPEGTTDHTCAFDWASAQWRWTDDYTAVLVAVCECEEESTLTAQVEYAVTAEPTCTEAGSASYTASMLLDGEEEPRVDVKTVELAALGHSFVEGICSVCHTAAPASAVDPVENAEAESIIECEHIDEDEDLICDLCGVDLRELYGIDFQDVDVDLGVGDFLTFTAEEAGSTLSFTWYSGDVWYSDGTTGWQPYEQGMTITLENVGDSVKFKGNHLRINREYEQTSNHFTMGGKIAASGSVTSMTDGVGTDRNVQLDWYCYDSMFSGCDALTSVSSNFLPSENLAEKCYARMFRNCTSLVSAPALPATSLPGGANYANMFQGCTALVNAPALPATSMSHSCYANMFNGCTSLTTAPELPSLNVGSWQSCYSGMFANCSSLVNVPAALPSPGVGISGYERMFANCTALTTAPNIEATSMNPSCFNSMFEGCTSLVRGPEKLKAATSSYCGARGMFRGCTSLTDAPELCATVLDEYCYNDMFNGCTSLTTAPDLPAKTVRYQSYSGMFAYCSSLVNPPKIDAETVGSVGCNGMFRNCTSLTTAPELKAETLQGELCYAEMFQNCTKLVNAPALPAENLVSECYRRMFAGCTALATAPVLNSEHLASSCYWRMFQGCTALVNAPETLPATTLASSCYSEMFSGCSSLTKIPKLPATQMANGCYRSMFSGCTSLTSIPELPAEGLAANCFAYMFHSCYRITELPKLRFKDFPAGSLEGMFVHGPAINQVALTEVESIDASIGAATNMWVSYNHYNGSFYLRQSVIDSTPDADIRKAFYLSNSAKIKGLTLGTDNDWHCWEEAWQHNDTHHWHQCEIRTCELTAAHDYAHMGSYEEHTYTMPGTWRWVRENNQDWVAYYTPVCECGVVGQEAPVTVEKDSSSKEYIVYKATVNYSGTEYSSERTEEIDYTVTYRDLSEKFKYGASVVVAAKDSDTTTKYNWYDITDGSKVLMATSNRYHFAVTKDTALESEEAQEAKPILNLTIGDRVNTDSTGKQSVKLTVQWSIPDELHYTFVSAGFVRAYSVAPATLSDISQLTTKNPTKLTTPNGTYSATVSMSAATALKTVNVAGYLTYKDANGVEHTIYSPISYSKH